MYKNHVSHHVSPLSYWCVYVFACLSVCVLAFAPNAHAQTTIDPRCWTKERCTEARKTQKFYGTEKPEEGFIQDSETKDVCGDKEGFCLPATQSKTTISFGGQTQFLHLGDFIKFMYRYAIIIAGILAVLMIVVAGFQWTASGGNSETISSAKKRITNAVIGLLLVVFSYTILTTINPALVNLRLPQVWLINVARITKEGDPCRTAGPKLKECQDLGAPGEYVCRPYYTPGTCQKIIETGVEIAALLVTGPLSAGESLASRGALAITKEGTYLAEGAASAAVKKAAQAGAGQFQKFGTWAFKTPWKNVVQEYKLLNGTAPGTQLELFADVAKQVTADKGSYLAFSKAVASAVAQNTLKGVVLPAGAAYAAAAGFELAEDAYKLLNPPGEPGLAGVCLSSHKYRNGEICNIHTPDDCASKKCIPSNVGYGCWVKGVELGVCASGDNGGVCRDTNDCIIKDGVQLKCVQTTVYVSLTGDDIKVCSDGKINSQCGANTDCQNGLECLKQGILKICTSQALLGSEDTPCTLGSTSDCSTGLVCQDKEQQSSKYLKCVRPCTGRGAACSAPNSNCKSMFDSLPQQLQTYYDTHEQERDARLGFYTGVEYFCQP